MQAGQKTTDMLRARIQDLIFIEARRLSRPAKVVGTKLLLAMVLNSS